MKLRDVKGKRIVKIVHTRWYNEHLKRWENDCTALLLDDGNVITVDAYETLDTPSATMILRKDSNLGRGSLHADDSKAPQDAK